MRCSDFVYYALAAAAVASAGCGVRGKPEPPLTPAELGRGKPTFKRETEGYAFPNVPRPDSIVRPTPTPYPATHIQDEED